MSFTALCHQIFPAVIDEYHRYDDVDHPIANPYREGSIEHLLYLKNWIDTVQWHLEDLIRDPQIDPVEALVLKRRIDRSNQERTDMVEYIDSYFLDKFKDVAIESGAALRGCLLPYPCAFSFRSRVFVGSVSPGCRGSMQEREYKKLCEFFAFLQIGI